MQLKALLQLLHGVQTWDGGIVIQVTAAAIGDIARGTVVVATLQAKTVTAISDFTELFERLQALLIEIGIWLSFRVVTRRAEVRLSVVERSGADRDKVIVSVVAALTRWIGAKRGGNVTTARGHWLGFRWLHTVVAEKESVLR